MPHDERVDAQQDTKWRYGRVQGHHQIHPQERRQVQHQVLEEQHVHHDDGQHGELGLGFRVQGLGKPGHTDATQELFGVVARSLQLSSCAKLYGFRVV